MGKTDLEAEDYVYSIHEWMTWKTLMGEVSQILYETVKTGERAPNPKVLSSDGTHEYNLLDFAKPGRPLVINFGSCT